MTVGLWIAFFATTVFGHLAMKLAVQGKESAPVWQTFGAMLNPWGLGGMAAWVLSAFVWLLIVAKEDLYVANSVSALRYLLIAMACWAFLQETPSPKDWGGMVLITVGVLMLR
ncbi:MAG: hypothetical protein QY326_08150 [Bdellovibrionota bacterium]|nr:MAG: hypothetical protein QY326_08150 [Bdellovibrionota bacterium]